MNYDPDKQVFEYSDIIGQKIASVSILNNSQFVIGFKNGTHMTLTARISDGKPFIGREVLTGTIEPEWQGLAATPPPRLQHTLRDGTWVDVKDEDTLNQILCSLKMYGGMDNQTRFLYSRMTPDELFRSLAAGNVINYGTMIYHLVRDANAIQE